MNLLIVESPAKAKTIGKYLGSDYIVISSYGHVRSIPSESGAVEPENDFAMRYEILPKAAKQIAAITAAAKKSDCIYLATDPDREGEAISWHILEVLKDKKVIKKSTVVKRAVFNEITKNAVVQAINNSRDIDINLVDAQKTRQALDYLVGFNLSPVLWRKLPGSKSAGRVQSVALRILCEREAEIEAFKSEEYWSIHGKFSKEDNTQINSHLIEFNGNKLDKLDIKDITQAENIIQSLHDQKFAIKKIEKKKVNRNPNPPFSTSTLIQEASRKLGFSAKKTSMVAQKLYEGISIKGELTGLITYMRTDSISISADAMKAANDLIAKRYGQDYLPTSPRIYKTKSKNAQEAHEAIRPTDVFKTPADLKPFLEDDQWRLYELIWNRLVASQMASAILDVMSVDISSENKLHTFRANGSHTVFQGFYKVYKEDTDDDTKENEKILPPLIENEVLKLLELLKDQHFTQGPPRYSEASLVKKMEELGIGRPSTYSSIISILQDRKYAILDKKRFIPEARGRLVNTFLTLFFKQYVEYDFTANLENELDAIADGKLPWKRVITDFWNPFKQKTTDVLSIKTSEVLIEMEKLLMPYIFHNELQKGNNLEDLRKCNKCPDGTLMLKNGKFGSFLACSNYPECNNTKKIDNALSEQVDDSGDSDFPKSLGKYDATDEEVTIRKGPYGIYIQRGDGKTAKRSSLPKTIDYKSVDLPYAIALLNMPREVGKNDSGSIIKAGIGKFGPYVECDGKYTSLRFAKLDPVHITLEEATSIIEKNKSKNKIDNKSTPKGKPKIKS